MTATLVVQRKRSRDLKASYISGVFHSTLQAKTTLTKNSYFINIFKAKINDYTLLQQIYETLQLIITEEKSTRIKTDT